MVKLIINGQIVDLYGDETIEMSVALRDFRTQGKNLASFTNTFTVPATDRNNEIFQFYYNHNRQVGLDNAFGNNVSSTNIFRSKVSAFIEIDELPFRQGYIKMNEGAYKNGVLDTYSINFYTNDINLFQYFGDVTLTALDWSAYNGQIVANNTRDGLQGGTDSGLGPAGDVIFPLIQQNYDAEGSGKWNATNLTDGSISHTRLKPAIKLSVVTDLIQSYLTSQGTNITLTSLSTDPNFAPMIDKLYMYLPYEYEGESNETGGRTSDITWATYDNTYDPNIVPIGSNIYDIALAKSESNQIRSTQMTINISHGPSMPYIIEEWVSLNGDIPILRSSTPTDTAAGYRHFSI